MKSIPGHTIAILAGAAVVFLSCRGEPSAQRIVDRSISAHGGRHVEHIVIDFDFRDYHYSILRSGGNFRYERARPDSLGSLRDVLDNDGFFREINGRRVELSEERSRAFASSVNSVAYFMLLPFKLNDSAVRKQYLGTVDLEGEPYDKVEITFEEQGGGRDYQDRFVFWFHREKHTMDYFAYDYVSDEGGTRFRKAINPRTIGGIRFADYLNYTSDSLASPGDPIERFDRLLEAGKLNLVSRIEMKDITVTPVEP